MGRVFDYPKIVLLGKFIDRIHIRRLAVEMHRHDRLGCRSHRCCDLRWVNCGSIGSDVDKNWSRTSRSHRKSSEICRKCRDDYLVPRPDAAGAQREFNRIRAVAHADAVRDPTEPCKLLLKRLEFITEHKPIRSKNALNSLPHLCLDGGELAGGGELRDVRPELVWIDAVILWVLHLQAAFL